MKKKKHLSMPSHKKLDFPKVDLVNCSGQFKVSVLVRVDKINKVKCQPSKKNIQRGD